MASRRVAVVTGGATGIGAAIVRRLRRDGFHVVFTYRESGVSENVARATKAAAEDWITAIHCDVRSSDSVNALATQVLKALGTPFAVVNNAGIAPHTDFLAISEKEWQNVIDTNLGGTFRVCQAFLPAMSASGSGVIVNVASELAFLGEPDLAHYVASKAGVLGITKSLARAFGPMGLRVNAVAPGPTDTRLLTPGERAPEYVRRLPLQRLGTADEIADTVSFLCSDAATWYTGQVLSPNGGAVMP